MPKWSSVNAEVMTEGDNLQELGKTQKSNGSVANDAYIVWTLSIGNPPTFLAQEMRKNLQFMRIFMRTGLTKKQKTTMIYFDEQSRIIEVQTHNTDLKKRLTAFAAKHPQCCRQTDDDEQGGLTFEIEKGRFSFRLTAPYSAERRRAASKAAKKCGVHRKVAHLYGDRN